MSAHLPGLVIVIPLVAAFLVLIGALLATLWGGPLWAEATYLGSYVWEDPSPDFGGFSAIDIRDQGQFFTAITDRGMLMNGQITRDAAGQITALDGFVIDIDEYERDVQDVVARPDGELWLLSGRGVRHCPAGCSKSAAGAKWPPCSCVTPCTAPMSTCAKSPWKCATVCTFTPWSAT